MRRRIAAVGDRVHPHRQLGAVKDFGQRHGMILVRVDAARRNQADEMASAAACFELFNKGDECGRALDFTAGNRRADARQVLHHHTPGTDIKMPDFGIAHLAFRQADVLAGGVQETMRAGLPQPVEIRRVGLADGIVARIVAPAPAIQNDQHHRPPPLHRQPPLIRA